MANGDIASAAGFFTPVSSGADFRVGYDDINRLADAAAKGAGFGAWSLAPISVNTALFGTLTDPNGASTGTLAGGVKVAGAMLLGSFRLTYTGATLTANASGNQADTTFCTLGLGYRPAAVRYVTFAITGVAQGSARIGIDGVCQIVSSDPNSAIPAGTVLQFDFGVPL